MVDKAFMAKENLDGIDISVNQTFFIKTWLKEILVTFRNECMVLKFRGNGALNWLIDS